MTQKEVIEIFNNQESHTWVMQYIQNNTIRTTSYRAPDMYNAITWLKYVTEDKSQLLECYDGGIYEAVMNES